MLPEGVNDTALAKRSITCVDWFRRDPAGGTIFVKPTEDDACVDHATEANRTVSSPPHDARSLRHSAE
jgi:hypothetical protein